MKTLLSLALLISSINCYSQLEKGYNETLSYVLADKDYRNHTITKSEDSYELNVFYNDNDKDKIKDTYCFHNQNNICYLIGLYSKLDHVNWIIESNNEQYVKMDKLKWKDYKNNIIFEITMKPDHYLQMIYKDKK